jgi:hypothetical protein
MHIPLTIATLIFDRPEIPLDKIIVLCNSNGMKTLTDLLNDYGIRKMAREIGVEPSSVSRWARDNKLPRWWVKPVQTVLGVKRFSVADESK